MNLLQPQVVPLQPRCAVTSQKVQLTYKLFLLENAKNTLEQELRDFTKRVYKEVKGILNSSFATNVENDLADALDIKCQAINNLSAILKDPIVEQQVCVQPVVDNGVRSNQIQSPGEKGILMTHVLKLGPTLKKVFMASPVAKAVQVLGATLSLQQLKHFLISQPAAAQEDDMIYSISSSYNSAVQTTSSSFDLQADKKEQAVIFEEKTQPDAAILPPSIIESPDIIAKRPPILLPPIQAVFPGISNPNPLKITSVIGSGWEGDVQVQHQKQTSSQLLHFLRTKAKNTGAIEVTVWDHNKSIYTSDSPQSMSPSVKTQCYHFKHVVTDDLIEAHRPKSLCVDTENQAPLFRVKQMDSSGSLTYTFVIATKTELWDIGNIFTEVQQAHSGGSQNRNAQVENSCVNIQWKTRNLQSTEPEREDKSAGVKTPQINSVAIPDFQIRRFEETEVVVSHIISPGSFYIQHADSITKLQALVTDSWKASSSYAEQNCIPDIGTQVMGWFPKQEQWCRAQVTKICGVSGDHFSDCAGDETSIKLEVKRLDYGDTRCLSLKDIKELSAEMAVLPLQALHVSLANVTPLNGSDWSEEAVDWFKTMVHNRTLYVRLYPQGSEVTAELFLERGKLGAMRRGPPLSLRLAQNGHAKHNKLKNVGLQKRNTVKPERSTEDSEWVRYLISCYTQNKRSM